MNIRPIVVKKDVAAMIVALSESTIDNLEKAGDFPKRRKISTSSVGYLVRELEEWAESRPVSDLLPAPDCGYGRAGKPK